MVEYLNFILINLTLDLVIIFSVKKFFRLYVSNLFLVFIQTLNVLACAVSIYCSLKFYQFCLIKLAVNFVICLLSINRCSIKELTKIFFFHMVISFSVYGFSALLFKFAKVSLSETLGIDTYGIFNFLLFFCIFLYVLIIYILMRTISKHKETQTFLKRVSFSLASQHIEFIGLLDSGNSLVDKRTGKPVVVVSIGSLKDYLSNSDYERVKTGDFSPLGVSHQTNFVTAGDTASYMPITDIGKITIEDDTGERQVECVLGFVNQNFSSEGGFDCLLHKDFI